MEGGESGYCDDVTEHLYVKELSLTKAAKLADFAGQPSFTYKCSVTSSQYTASPPSTEVDVVANVVTLGKVLYQIKLVGSET